MARRLTCLLFCSEFWIQCVDVGSARTLGAYNYYYYGFIEPSTSLCPLCPQDLPIERSRSDLPGIYVSHQSCPEVI